MKAGQASTRRTREDGQANAPVEVDEDVFGRWRDRFQERLGGARRDEAVNDDDEGKENEKEKEKVDLCVVDGFLLFWDKVCPPFYCPDGDREADGDEYDIFWLPGSKARACRREMRMLGGGSVTDTDGPHEQEIMDNLDVRILLSVPKDLLQSRREGRTYLLESELSTSDEAVRTSLRSGRL